MRVINCPWEKENLECVVAEVCVEFGEKINKDELLDLEKTYDYIVVKAPVGSMIQNITLSELGYTTAEMQITIKKSVSELESQIGGWENKFILHSDIKKVDDQDDLDEIIAQMSPNMFSTDRIHLDPFFGPEYGLRRYVNWIKTEFVRGSLIHQHFYKEKFVGFSMVKNNTENTMVGLLSGTFEKYQMGMGVFLPLLPVLLKSLNLNLFEGKISTNNVMMARMYNKYMYHFTDYENVFIKHIK